MTLYVNILIISCLFTISTFIIAVGLLNEQTILFLTVCLELFSYTYQLVRYFSQLTEKTQYILCYICARGPNETKSLCRCLEYATDGNWILYGKENILGSDRDCAQVILNMYSLYLSSSGFILAWFI